jgi:hypothetical protein
MKKIFLITALFFIATLQAQPPAKGKVKIYLHSIRCEKATADDLFDGDGKGDEVFITVFYSVASSNGTTRYINKVATSVYGDNRNWPARVKAGSASTTGGIKANDIIYVHPQTEERMPIGDERFKGLAVIEADLEAGDILTIIPVLSEWDGNATNNQNSFESFISNSFNNVNTYMAGLTQRFNMSTASRAFSDNASNCINMGGLTQLLQTVNGAPGNRPIGMAQNGSYNPQVYVFNSAILENWNTIMEPSYSSYSSYNLPVYYDEPRLGNNRDHGKYTLLIYPEFIKSVSVPPPANSNNNSITRPVKTIGIKNQSLDQPVATTTKLLFVGNWSGTQTNDYGQYPQAINFELTNNNEFLMTVKSTGAVAVRGTYTTSGISISGSYKQLSSGETFSFTGTFDSNTQKLTCTLGSGNATKGQGILTMSKNAATSNLR